jgi:hypothetical protein
VEGVRAFEPEVFPQEETLGCSVDGDILELKCHSFLQIYVRDAIFGRNYSNGKKMCDGDKPADSKEMRSKDDTCWMQIRGEAKTICHGVASCRIPVAQDLDRSLNRPLQSVCNGLKKEMRVSYICGRSLPLHYPKCHLPSVECYPWASYVETPYCVATALLLGGWATMEELALLSTTDMTLLLVAGLHTRLHPEVHSTQELTRREVAAPQGGLCGLAAIQHALGSTVATRSLLRTLHYDSMRVAMAKEIKINVTRDLPLYNDPKLLEEFHSCGLCPFLLNLLH